MWPSEASLGVLSSREIPARFPSDQHVANTWPLIPGREAPWQCLTEGHPNVPHLRGQLNFCPYEGIVRNRSSLLEKAPDCCLPSPGPSPQTLPPSPPAPQPPTLRAPPCDSEPAWATGTACDAKRGKLAHRVTNP